MRLKSYFFADKQTHKLVSLSSFTRPTCVKILMKIVQKNWNCDPDYIFSADKQTHKLVFTIILWVYLAVLDLKVYKFLMKIVQKIETATEIIFFCGQTNAQISIYNVVSVFF